MQSRKTASSRSWDAVADWYAGWSGPNGSKHHRRYAIPAITELLAPRPGESILDIGCGPGPLAPAIRRLGARYTGLDSSRKLVAIARRSHRGARFLEGDATRLDDVPELAGQRFNAVTFLLSLQDIDPLDVAIASAGEMLRPGGRLVALLTHPCFRVPRQSGWGWDERRQLRFRRIDRYLTPVAVPMQAYGAGRQGSTLSYHRPLGDYFAALTANGLAVDSLREIATATEGERQSGARAAEREFPLFLALRAIRR